MDALLRFASVFSTAAIMAVAITGLANAGYKIPDDCLGDWDYCNSLWIRKFDKFGRDFFDIFPSGEENDPIGSREANSRYGCREGREIIAARGFRHVRIVECRGRTYTYLARRHGDTFRILVSSRSGRIIDMDPI